MDEFDFEDDVGIEAKVTSMSSKSQEATVTSSASSSPSRTHRRKRFRLNYGSSALSGRGDDDDSSKATLHDDKSDDMSICRNKGEITSSQNSKTSWQPRRRKRQATQKKKHDKESDIFPSTSFSTSSSPSSFLSPIKSSSASSKDAQSCEAVTTKSKNYMPDGTPPGSPPLQKHTFVHWDDERKEKVTSSTTIESKTITSISREVKTTTKGFNDSKSNLDDYAIDTHDDDMHNDVDNDTDDEQFATDNDRTIQHLKSPQSSQAHSSIISYESEKILTGAGTDMHAVQDAGSSRLVLDDCNFYCSSFFNGIGVSNDTSKTKKYTRKAHSSSTADATCDLALLMATRKARSVLINLSMNRSTRPASDESKENTISDQNTLDSIIRILEFVPQFIQGSSLPSVAEVTLDSDSKWNDKNIIVWDDFISTLNTEANKDKNELSTVNSSKSWATGRKTKVKSENIQSSNDIKKGSIYDKVVCNALSIIVHYISLDCTCDSGQFSSITNPQLRKSFQKEILRKGFFIRAIARLILSDHIVSTILTERYSELKEENDDNISASKSFSVSRLSPMNADPTKRGRKKKRIRKQGAPSCHQLDPENSAPAHVIQKGQQKKSYLDFYSDDANSAFSRDKDSVSSDFSTNDLPSRFKQKITKALQNSKRENGDDSFCLNCKDLVKSSYQRSQNSGSLALNAFLRILSGKYDSNTDIESSDSNPTSNNPQTETSDEGDTSDSYFDADDSECDEIESRNLNNPIFFKNFMVRRSGSIPFLTRGIVETLEACIVIFQECQNDTEKCCFSCIEYLRDRLHSISTILDNLCCLSGKNRKLFCCISQLEHIPIFIPSLLRTVTIMNHLSKVESKKQIVFEEISLSALRMLTSLTHENSNASDQLCSLSIQHPFENDTCTSGVHLIIDTLHSLIQIDPKPNSLSYHANYDAKIFCLNTLTNALESPSYAKVSDLIYTFRRNQPEKISDSITMIACLTRWIVKQTDSFRDTIVQEFRDSEIEQNKVDIRDLAHNEDEHLVVAGNGFIFLSCLLGVHDDIKNEDQNRLARGNIQKEIFNELPGKEEKEKITLMINTLKAFCNFYRLSIGDLSVAVVTPVLSIIEGLEKSYHL